MKHILRLVLALVLTMTVSCKSDKKEEETIVTDTKEQLTKETNETPSEVDRDKKLTVELSPKNENSSTGKVIFSQKNGVLTMLASLKNLSEGEHVLSIYDTTDISSVDDTAAEANWSLKDQSQKNQNDTSGFSNGEISGFTVGKDNRGTVTMTTDEWCIGCEDDSKDITGKVIIVHQNVTASKISCGGIIE